MKRRSQLVLVVSAAMGATALVWWMSSRDGAAGPPGGVDPSTAATVVDEGSSRAVAKRRDDRAGAASLPTPPPLANEAELDAFLEALLKKASASDEPDDAERQLAIAAIRSLSGKVHPAVLRTRAHQFSRRRAQMKRDRELAPLNEVLAELSDEIRQEREPMKRQRLVSEYRKRASLMPELYRLAALDRLRTAMRGAGGT